VGLVVLVAVELEPDGHGAEGVGGGDMVLHGERAVEVGVDLVRLRRLFRAGQNTRTSRVLTGSPPWVSSWLSSGFSLSEP